MNIARFAGFICGVGVAVLLIWALMRRLNTDGKRKTEYDERQKAARGVGYMYAFYVLAGWMAVMMAKPAPPPTMDTGSKAQTTIHFRAGRM